MKNFSEFSSKVKHSKNWNFFDYTKSDPYTLYPFLPVCFSVTGFARNAPIVCYFCLFFYLNEICCNKNQYI